MPYYLSGDVCELCELWSTPIGVPRDVQFFKKVKDITVLNRTLAQEIDKKNKTVTIVDLKTNTTSKIPYDKLVLAVGATPFIPDFDGRDLNGVCKLNDPFDAEMIKKRLNSGVVKSAVIVGAGLIGLEVTEALTKLGIKVTVVEMLDRVLPKMLDFVMSNLLTKHIQSKGVDVSVNNKVLSFKGDDQGNLRTVITEKGPIEVEKALISIGVRPNIKIAEDAGLKITENHAIEIN